MSQSDDAPPTPGMRPPAYARSAVFALRLLLLVLSSGAVLAAFTVGRWGGRQHDSGQPRYVCPMHAEVTSAVPGQCPICRMDLEPVRAPGETGAIIASTYQTYDFVRKRGFGQEIRGPAWIDDDGVVNAVLYKEDLGALSTDQRGAFFPSEGANDFIGIRLLPDLPMPWDRSTSRVRFALDGLSAAPPRAIGWVKLSGKRREQAVIPFSAVLEGVDGPYVLVAAPDGRTLAKRPIEIGKVVGGQAIVLSGLRFQERILVRSAFFVDAERRLRRQATVELGP